MLKFNGLELFSLILPLQMILKIYVRKMFIVTEYAALSAVDRTCVNAQFIGCNCLICYNNGLLLSEFCKQTGLRIMNGMLGEDKGVGRYTFVGSRGSSVVDYVLSTQDLFTNIRQFKVHKPNILSDHCLLTFLFAFQIHDVREATDDNFDQVSGGMLGILNLRHYF